LGRWAKRENIVTREKETIKDFLIWARYARSTQLQEMPEWTEDYYCVDEDQLIDDYLETLKEIL
jgi:hypothetical protein